MSIEQKIEAILFVAGGATSVQTLVKTLGVSRKEIESGLDALHIQLQHRGIRLVRLEHTVSLTTAPEVSETVTTFLQEELQGGLSRAALETLTIILYKSPVHRAQIDYIRGVNSSYTLHTLLMRGLIERIPDPKDARAFLYKPSIEFLKYCGVTSLEALPEYKHLQALKNEELAQVMREQEQAVKTEQEQAETPSS